MISWLLLLPQKRSTKDNQVPPHHQPELQAEDQEAQGSSETTQHSDPNRSMQPDLIGLY